MSKFLYCPICGKIMSSFNKKCCPNCKGTLPPVESRYDSSYYRNKAKQVYGVTAESFKILIKEEVSKSSCFDKTKCIYDIDIEYKNAPIQKSAINMNQPKCPTCGSTNIKKISLTSKAIGATMFGLFSKNATSQFKCNNCGYKW